MNKPQIRIIRPPQKPKKIVVKRLLSAFRQAAIGLVGFTLLPYATDPVADNIPGICATNENNASVRNTQPVAPRYEYGSDLQAELAKLSDEKPFILLGDTNHSDPILHSYLRSPALLEELADAGVTDLYVEVLSSVQPDIDALTSGEISIKTFMARNGSLSMWVNSEDEELQSYITARFFLRAAELGIKIHAIDEQEDINPVAGIVLGTYINDMVQTHASMCSKPLNEITPTFENYFSLTRAPYTIMSAFASTAVLSGRFDDSDSVPHITSPAKGRYAAIIYGAAHFADSENSFYGYLRDKTAALVYIFSLPQVAQHDDMGIENNKTAVRIVPQLLQDIATNKQPADRLFPEYVPSR